MKRREFIRSAAVVSAGIGAASGMAGSVASAMLDADMGRFREGQTFRTACGGQLTLSQIVQRDIDARINQYGLMFEGEVCGRLGEGTHRLQGEQGELALYLQPSESGLVAWFSQLA